MTIWLVEGEHPVAPDRIISLHRTREGAIAQAVSLTQAIAKDHHAAYEALRAPVDEGNWEQVMARLQDIHGARTCYVEISEHEVGA